jgi:hypothetical protein
MAIPFFTIGHSTRSIGEFIDLLAASQVSFVVDVRTIPRPRTNPQYNREALPEPLSGSQIAYEHVAELGGRRTRARDRPSNVNGFWKTRVFSGSANTLPPRTSRRVAPMPFEPNRFEIMSER